MGKPSQSHDRPAEDAISLHSQPGQDHDPLHVDNDAPEFEVDDLPPLYSDIGGSSSNVPLLADTPSVPLGDSLPFFVEDTTTGRRFYLNGLLSSDPQTLERHVQTWALQPPRPMIRINGHHKATVNENGKSTRKNITDFDVRIDLTPYLYSNATNATSWRELRTIENTEKARRGTVFAQRAPGVKHDLEVGGSAKPTLSEWCHMYCANHAGLKTFSVHRRMVGFDQEKVKQKVEALVRATNYRGNLHITFPVQNDLVEVYNDCQTNKWRLTGWVFWLFALTFLWMFSWPYLALRTKHFEVVKVDWYYSRPAGDGTNKYVSLSEDQWYNLWGRALNKAILEKRQCTLDQQDLLDSEGAQPTFDTGNTTVDGALGFIRAGVNAMNHVNRQLGWGRDEA